MGGRVFPPGNFWRLIGKKRNKGKRLKKWGKKKEKWEENEKGTDENKKLKGERTERS